MVAIASLPTTATTPGRARPIGFAPAGRPGRPRPELHVVPPAAHRTRRAAVGRPAGSLVLAIVLALAVVLAAGHLIRTPGLGAGAAPAPATHVVAEGDTMWAIAVEHAPAGEAAGYVEQLVAANGGATVAPGQVVTLPAP